jgi:CBS domain-containing protein
MNAKEDLPRRGSEGVESLREDHAHVTAVFRELEAIAFKTAEAPTPDAWHELRRAFQHAAAVLADHTTREEMILRRVLEEAGPAMEHRLATMLRAHSHEAQLASLRKFNAELALATQPAPSLAEEIDWLSAMNEELQQEVTLYVNAPRAVDGGKRRPVPCGEVMRRPVRWVADTDTVRAAARVMRNSNVGFLVVCDASARVVGTLTDRDIVTRFLADEATDRDAVVASVMTCDAVSCRPEDDISVAENAMMRHQKSRIVVADAARHALGVISIDDIAQRSADPSATDVLRSVHARAVRRRVTIDHVR